MRFVVSPIVFPVVMAFGVFAAGGCSGGGGTVMGPDSGMMNNDGDPGTDSGGDAGMDAPPWNGMDPTVMPGDPARILLLGKIVTPDTEIDGQVLVENGIITCVDAGAICSAEPGAMGATIITTNGVIAPGLIDTHNHILFDIFDNSDWLPSKLYMNHNQWGAEAKYAAMVDTKQCLNNDSKPTWCAMTPYGTPTTNLHCELDKWGELKGMIAGTTSIVGLAGAGSTACFNSLSRSIDTPDNGGLGDKIQTSALFPPSTSSGDGVCANFADGDTNAYLIHCGEGIDGTALNEFSTLNTLTTVDGCLLAPQTTLTHGTAFTMNEFTTMAMKGMKLTWSPASNVALYGKTADIPAALTAGVKIALGPDWSMGGSQNMLDELRFADDQDNKNFGNKLTPKDLLVMATMNGAATLGFADKLGQIKKGYVADLFVVAGNPATPYAAILAATPKQVSLVMIGGKILYGDVSIQSAAPSMPGCETIDICMKQKFLCVATTDTTNKLNQTYAEIKKAIDDGLVLSDMVTMADGFNFAPIAPIVACK